MRTFVTLMLASLIGLATLTAQADDRPNLTIYTYDAFAADWGPAPKIKENFEKSCECTVDFVTADSSIGALRKVQLEGAETKADIVLGLDTNITQNARETGLFIPHGVEKPDLVLPIKWDDELFLPFDFGFFAFVYDKNIVKNPPRSFDELAAMPDDFKIIIQDPRSSTPGLGLLLWVKHVYGEEAADYWKSIAPKILTVTKSWSDAYGLFLKGEADMVLSYTTSPAYHLIAEEKDNYAAAPFAEGHYMQVEVAGILKSSKQQALAKKFFAFMLTAGFQDVIPTTNWVYPVVKTGAGLPKGFETLHAPDIAMLFDDVTVEGSRQAYIDEWLDALGR